MGIWNAGIDCYLSKELTKNDLQALGSVRDRTAITPNMHMHTHLKSGIEDYGPLYAFVCSTWTNNNRNIE